MKSLVILGLFFTLSLSLVAQQNSQYTQFQYSKLWMNPGYAGSHKVGCFQGISRNQWLGLDGAPVSQTINYHTPLFGDRVGLGFSFNHDEIGPTNSYFFNMSYAYRIKTKKGRMALGMQANITSHAINFHKLDPLESGDGILPLEKETKLIPNFGVGLYYNTDKFYIGLSVPLILNGDISFDAEGSNILSRQETHAYLMAGVIHRISARVKGKPSILLKKVTNAPFDVDINYSFIFFDRLWAGGSYRFGGDQIDGVGESIDLAVQYQLTHGFRLGIAYDFTLSELKSANDGTVEVMAQYCISRNPDNLTNPRYF